MKLIIRSNNMQEIEGITAEYPYVLNHVDGIETRVPWHWHEELEFGYVLKGTLKVMVAGQTYVFREKEGFFINTDILHMMEADNPEEGAVWESYLFHSVFLTGHFRSVFETKYIEPVLKNKKTEILHFTQENYNQSKILEMLMKVSGYDEIKNQEFQIRNTFSEIWLLLMEEIAEQEKSPSKIKKISQERIQLMLGYIHMHYNEKITLEQIASAAFISTRECLRCFQNCIDKTPFEYLMDYRIQMAEKLLKSTALPVTDIALQTGFNSSAYFSKIFKQFRHMSPGDYRRQ